MRDRIKVPRTLIEEVDDLLREAVVVPKPREHLKLGISDPDDEWIVASAVAGRADVLVTGDSALLEAASRAPLPVLSPRGLWDVLRGNKPTK